MNGFKTDRHGFIHGNDTPHKGQDYRSDCGGVQVDQRESVANTEQGGEPATQATDD